MATQKKGGGRRVSLFWVAIPMPASTMTIIGPAFSDMLISSGMFTSVNCISAINDETRFPTNDAPYVILTPWDFHDPTRDSRGAGRYFSTYDGEFRVTVWLRNALDISQQNPNMLFNPDPNLGLYALMNQVADILQLCFPQDTDGNFVLTEPPWLARFSHPIVRPDSVEWGGIQMFFALQFSQSYTMPDVGGGIAGRF